MAIARKQPQLQHPPKQPDPTFYGTTLSSGTFGQNEWLGHNANETWSDGGASNRVVGQHADTLGAGVDQLITDLRQNMTADMSDTIARQVAEAILEYASAIEFEIGLVAGQIVVAAVLKNEKAEIRTYVPLSEVLQKSLQLAKDDTTFKDGLQTLVTELAIKPKPVSSVAPQAQQTASKAAPEGASQKAGRIGPVAAGANAAAERLGVPSSLGAFDDFGSPMARR